MGTTWKENLSKVWKDPVWAGFISTVLSAAFLGIVGLVWILLGNHTFAETYALLLKGLAYRVPVYFVLSLVGAYFIVKLIARLVKPKRLATPDPIWDAQIGHYSFRELYTILSASFLPVTTVAMDYSYREPPKQNLLIMFMTNNSFYNRGVSINYPGTGPHGDGGYCWSILAPRLMEYGLLRQAKEPDEEVAGVMNEVYYTTETGTKFHANMEKLFLRDRELYDKLNNYTWDKLEAQIARDEAEEAAKVTPLAKE